MGAKALHPALGYRPFRMLLGTIAHPIWEDAIAFPELLFQ
jgi:hypothetical protein